jgi:aquaporin Z
MELFKKAIAEMIGTCVLVVLGCGVAVATGCEGNAGIVATSLAFGLSIVAMAYSIGNVSGCHINPAVSLGFLVAKKMSLKDFLVYLGLSSSARFLARPFSISFSGMSAARVSPMARTKSKPL